MTHKAKIKGYDNEGNATLLAEFRNPSEAIAWAKRYVSSQDAGNWNCVLVRHGGRTIYAWDRD